MVGEIPVLSSSTKRTAILCLLVRRLARAGRGGIAIVIIKSMRFALLDELNIWV